MSILQGIFLLALLASLVVSVLEKREIEALKSESEKLRLEILVKDASLAACSLQTLNIKEDALRDAETASIPDRDLPLHVDPRWMLPAAGSGPNRSADKP